MYLVCKLTFLTIICHLIMIFFFFFKWPALFKPVQIKYVVWSLLIVLHLCDTKRRSRSMTEWTSIIGIRYRPNETCSRLHHDVIFPVSSCQIITVSPPRISVHATTFLPAPPRSVSPPVAGMRRIGGLRGGRQSQTLIIITATFTFGCRVISVTCKLLQPAVLPGIWS